MGGPSVGILLQKALTEKQKEQILEWIEDYSSFYEKKEYSDWCYNFWISNSKPFGYSYEGVGLPYSIVLQEPDCDDGVNEKTRDEFGFVPKQEICLIAHCNSDDDHYILGNMALIFSREFEGIIDMGGAILPPRRQNPSVKEYPWVTLEEIRCFVDNIPGRVLEIQYLTANNKQWLYHIVDNFFLAEWIKHPCFSMIK